MAVKKPPQRLLDLAAKALPKAAAQRTAAEKRAVRLTKAYRLSQTAGQAGGRSALTPYSMNEIIALATQLAQGDIQPQQQQITREQERQAQLAAGQQQLVGGLTQSLGGLVGGIGSTIQGTYRQAAQDQSGFAAGFADGMKDIAQREASQTQADLAKWGAPQGQIDAAGAIGEGSRDVLYGQGGYTPSVSLGQQGAAFGAYGAGLPGVVARMGQQDAADISARASETQRQLSEQAADLAAQLPALRRQYIQQLMSNELDKTATAMALKRLGLEEDAQAFGQQMDMAEFGFQQDQFAADQAAESGAAKSAAMKQRDAYLLDITDAMKAAWAEISKEFLAASGSVSPGGPGLGVGPTAAAAAAGGGTKPTYSQAFSAIYQALKAALGTSGARGWKYGVRDAVVRQKIRKFLESKNIRPGGVVGGSDRPFGPTGSAGSLPPRIPGFS